jgi:Ger(x)C family germination protein
MKKGILLLVVLCLLCCACDGRRIQDMLFVFALGIDYKDGKYEVYGQIINFSTLAGGENTGPPQETDNLWIGKSSDPILENAFYKLRSSSNTLSSSHLTAFIFGPGILKNKHTHVLDQIFRSRTTRLTPWLFASDEPLDKVLSITPFMTKTPYFSIYSQPQAIFQQDSIIPPIRVNRFTSQINEPDNVTIIPTLGIAKKIWKNEKKNLPQLKVNGAYILTKNKPTSSFSMDKLLGIRWLSEQTVSTPVYLTPKKEEYITITARKPNVHLQTTLENNQTHYYIDIHVKAELVHTNTTMPIKQMAQILTEKIEQEVTSTYQMAAQQNIDILRLRFHTYQKNPKLWKQITKKPISQDKITVHVKADILNSGFLKNETLID